MRRPGSVSGSIPTSPKKGGHRSALHRPAGRQRSGLPGRDGAEAAKSFPGQQLVTPADARGRTCHTGDRLRPAGQRLLFGAFQPASGAAFTAPMMAAPRPTGSTSWARSKPGSIPQSSGCMHRSTTSALTARPTCCCSACPIRAGSSSSSPICGLPQPDRAMVEGAALPGPQRSPVRNLGRDRQAVNAPPPTGTRTAIPSSGDAVGAIGNPAVSVSRLSQLSH